MVVEYTNPYKSPSLYGNNPYKRDGEMEKEPSIENWRKVWREGFAPILSTTGLIALNKALKEDDDRLTQGSTTTPPPLQCVQDWPVEGCCALGFCGWKGDGLETVGDVEAYFAKCCFEADKRLGEPAGCRWFLDWFDDTPRDIMRATLIEEVNLVLNERYDYEYGATGFNQYE